MRGKVDVGFPTVAKLLANCAAVEVNVRGKRMILFNVPCSNKDVL